MGILTSLGIPGPEPMLPEDMMHPRPANAGDWIALVFAMVGIIAFIVWACFQR